VRIRFALTGALAALVAVLALTAGTATAADPATSLTTPVAGTTNTGSALSGVATITGFALNSAGQLVANGTITGTLTDATGAVTNLTDTTFSTIVTPAASGPGCQILDLTLGPLNLNLLGLVVTLNQVHLNITAVPGPGNLLGNLLCSVTHLLDSGNTGGLQSLLNILNGLLGGL
jgi:hypothetical protein